MAYEAKGTRPLLEHSALRAQPDKGIMKKTSLAIIALATQLWSFSAPATSSCEFVQQKDQETLTRCIDKLRKEIDRHRSEIDNLKTKNALISKQLCMLAIEQHRSNSQSEALKLIIEDACVQFKNLTAPEKRS